MLTQEQLLEGVNSKGINFITKNLKLETIVQEFNTITYYFEGGYRLESTGYSASSEDVLVTNLLNSKGQILATW